MIIALAVTFLHATALHVARQKRNIGRRQPKSLFVDIIVESPAHRHKQGLVNITASECCPARYWDKRNNPGTSHSIDRRLPLPIQYTFTHSNAQQYQPVYILPMASPERRRVHAFALRRVQWQFHHRCTDDRVGGRQLRSLALQVTRLPPGAPPFAVVLDTRQLVRVSFVIICTLATTDPPHNQSRERHPND